MLITKSKQRLIDQAVEIEQVSPRDAGTIGFMTCLMVLATLPHSKPSQNEFVRKNGEYTLTIICPTEIGLPYGSYPRLILAWICTEAIRKQSRHLYLGPSLRQFLKQLEITSSGGPNGTLRMFSEQYKRLFCSSISCIRTGKNGWAYDSLSVSDQANFWWDPLQQNNSGRWVSHLTLNDNFFQSILKCPVPIDMRALFALRKSPLSMDIYLWATHRLPRLRRPTILSWEVLMMKFGSQYKCQRQFKRRFIEALNKVVMVYHSARIDERPSGILIRYSKPHVPMKNQ